MKGIVDPRRIRSLNSQTWKAGPVVYWMGRDQRVKDNWALLAAADLASRNATTLFVYFVLPQTFLDATRRQYDFLLQGLKVVAQELQELSIPFIIEVGDPEVQLTAFVQHYGIAAVVTDCNPLQHVMAWKEKIAVSLSIPLYEVDAHNVVPIWQASPKREWAAYTIRPKIHKQLDDFLTNFPAIPQIKAQNAEDVELPAIDWDMLNQSIAVQEEVKPITWCKPGAKEALAAMEYFLTTKLHGYDTARNNPSSFGQSDLSPYLHFGHLSAQRLAFEVSQSGAPSQDKEAFLEELIIRRELSDNFTFYTEDYVSLAAAPAWAQESLSEHRHDVREHTYTYEELAFSKTHDTLWNAAQTELRLHGKMHGYLRMLWAKKILEWTDSPEDALAITVKLNDTYSIDGCDPNGYVGILWSLAGLHDRPWFEREIYGKVRYMSSDATAKKFKLESYLRYVANLV